MGEQKGHSQPMDRHHVVVRYARVTPPNFADLSSDHIRRLLVFFCAAFSRPYAALVTAMFAEPRRRFDSLAAVLVDRPTQAMSLVPRMPMRTA